MSTWPADVLVMNYLELAQNPSARLQMLGFIGKLCKKSPGQYTAASLALQDEDWQRLSLWIEKGYGSPFFSLVNGNIHVKKTCEKHILIGTYQIMLDLNPIENQEEVRGKMPTFEDIWAAACQYVNAEIRRGASDYE